MRLINNSIQFIQQYISADLATLLDNGIKEIMDNKKTLKALNKECLLYIIGNDIPMNRYHEFVIKDLMNSVRDYIIRTLNETMDNQLHTITFL
jgi:sulfur transfer complex TusBCD TusB component (DsrH family)